MPVFQANPVITRTFGDGAPSGTGTEGHEYWDRTNDRLYLSDGTQWYVTHPGGVLQVVNYQTGAVATGTTVLPTDDTIPQNTEGTQFMTLAITPVSASSYLLIDVTITLSFSLSAYNIIAALFVDSTAGALAAVHWAEATGTYPGVLSFRHYVASASTTARTYKVRAGADGAGTITFNGVGGTRRFGGVNSSSITIMEIAP